MELPCDIKYCKADCCGIVPISLYTYEKNKHLIENPEEVTLLEFDKDNVIPVRGAQCAFLGKDFKCKIYNQRPDICRRFGLGGHPLLECPYLEEKGFYKGEKK